ncbi:laminin subunit alpha-1-like [Helicoverpa zea]|uniref:laminin subunit alpha-1-like n=1 Tax=Helicoverpa zea TaxID=7113 RepID=UPI001F57CF36|nr:laminin subunit alpha-1-like [Helicoverpa zea]
MHWWVVFAAMAVAASAVAVSSPRRCAGRLARERLKAAEKIRDKRYFSYLCCTPACGSGYRKPRPPPARRYQPFHRTWLGLKYGCNCSSIGSESNVCDIRTGQCRCKQHVTGRACDTCEEGYWGLKLGGCRRCACGPGASACDPETGACACADGVGGAHCDTCLSGYYGFGPAGCLPCPSCSDGKVCSPHSGRCVCPGGSMGAGCRQCARGYWAVGNTCRPCSCGAGAVSNICDGHTGECKCRAGWAGGTCEQCAAGHYGPKCRPCQCHAPGTRDCDDGLCPCDEWGRCNCKENVVGEKCDACLSGTFGLSAHNPSGCTACFCFGRAAACTQATLSRAALHAAAPLHVTLQRPAQDVITTATLSRAALHAAAPLHVTLQRPAQDVITTVSSLQLPVTTRRAAPRVRRRCPAPRCMPPRRCMSRCSARHRMSSLRCLSQPVGLHRVYTGDAVPRRAACRRAAACHAAAPGTGCHHYGEFPTAACHNPSGCTACTQATLSRAALHAAAPLHVTLQRPAQDVITTMDQDSLLAIHTHTPDPTITLPWPPVPVYVELDKRFVGDRVTSYGGSLRFRVEEEGGVELSHDVIKRFPLVRLYTKSIVLEYFETNPGINGTHSVRLHESLWHVRGGGRASRSALMLALRALDKLLIRLTTRAPTRTEHVHALHSVRLHESLWHVRGGGRASRSALMLALRALDKLLIRLTTRAPTRTEHVHALHSVRLHESLWHVRGGGRASRSALMLALRALDKLLIRLTTRAPTRTEHVHALHSVRLHESLWHVRGGGRASRSALMLALRALDKLLIRLTTRAPTRTEHPLGPPARVAVARAWRRARVALGADAGAARAGQAAHPPHHARAHQDRARACAVSVHSTSPGTHGSHSVRLHESLWHVRGGGRASRSALMLALRALDKLLIRLTTRAPTRTEHVHALLLNVSLDTAIPGLSRSEPALGVELCDCPRGYSASSCQTPAPGYWLPAPAVHMATVAGTIVISLEGDAQPCMCNGRATECHPETGECLNCTMGTGGPRCASCAAGHYGSPGAPGGCQACPCPERARNFADACVVHHGKVQCLCKPGYTGPECAACAGGYRRAGGACVSCGCHAAGSHSPHCDAAGRCRCRDFATGARCDQCRPYRTYMDEDGCRPCDNCTLTLLDSVEALTSELRTKADPTELSRIPKPFAALREFSHNTTTFQSSLNHLKNNLEHSKNLEDRLGQLEDMEHRVFTEANALKSEAKRREKEADYLSLESMSALEEVLKIRRQISEQVEALDEFARGEKHLSAHRALKEAKHLLRQIKDLKLIDYVTGANDVFDAAHLQSTSVQERNYRLQDTYRRLSSLRSALDTWELKAADLQKLAETVWKADDTVTALKERVKPRLAAVRDIGLRCRLVLEDITTLSANNITDEIRSSLLQAQTLGIKFPTLAAELAVLTLAAEEKEGILYNLTPVYKQKYLEAVEKHVTELGVKAKEYKSLFAGSRAAASLGVSAAQAWSHVATQVKEAAAAADAASKAAAAATSLAQGNVPMAHSAAKGKNTSEDLKKRGAAVLAKADELRSQLEHLRRGADVVSVVLRGLGWQERELSGRPRATVLPTLTAANDQADRVFASTRVLYDEASELRRRVRYHLRRQLTELQRHGDTALGAAQEHVSQIRGNTVRGAETAAALAAAAAARARQHAAASATLAPALLALQHQVERARHAAHTVSSVYMCYHQTAAALAAAAAARARQHAAASATLAPALLALQHQVERARHAAHTVSSVYMCYHQTAAALAAAAAARARQHAAASATLAPALLALQHQVERARHAAHTVSSVYMCYHQTAAALAAAAAARARQHAAASATLAPALLALQHQVERARHAAHTVSSVYMCYHQTAAALAAAAAARARQHAAASATLAPALLALQHQVERARHAAHTISVSLTSPPLSAAGCARAYAVWAASPAVSRLALALSFDGKMSDGPLLFLSDDTQETERYMKLSVANSKLRLAWQLGAGEAVILHPELLQATHDDADHTTYRVDIERVWNTVHLRVERLGSTSTANSLTSASNSSAASAGSLQPSQLWLGWPGGGAGLPACVHALYTDDRTVGLWNFVQQPKEAQCTGCTQRWYSGRGDEPSMVWFNGAGYVELVRSRARPADRRQFSVAFTFRTRDEDALLFMALDTANNRSVSVTLRECRVVFTVEYGGSRLQITAAGRHCGGRPAHVQAIRVFASNKLEKGSLRVNGEETLGSPAPPVQAPAALPDLARARYWLGGAPPGAPGPAPRPLLGCVGAVTVDRAGYDLMDAPTRFGVEPRCGERTLRSAILKGTGYIELPSPLIRRKASLGISFRTHAPDGLLLYRPPAVDNELTDDGDKHYFALVMKAGELELVADAGKGEMRLRTNGTRFDDGRLHTVRIIRMHKQLELWVDEEQLGSGSLPGSAFPARPAGMFLGGVRETLQAAVPLIAFKGTLADFIVDAQLIGLQTAISWSGAALGRADGSHARPPRAEPRALHQQPDHAGCTKTSSYTVEAGAVKFGDTAHSHAHLRLPRSPARRRDLALSLQIRTFATDGLLLLAPGSKGKPKQFMALVLRESKLRLVVRNRKRKEIALAANVSDGNWRQVSIRVSRNRVQLSSEGAAVTARTQASARAHRLYVGGLPAPPALPHLPNWITLVRGFLGCIRRVSVNGRAEDLVRDAQAHHGVGQCFPNVERAAYFGGDAYATWSSSWQLAAGAEELRLQFRTSEPDGVLLAAAGLLLEIKDGAVSILPRTLVLYEELRLQFRTSEPDGVLLAAAGLLLEIKDGAVVLSRSWGGSERSRIAWRAAGGGACDGAWHSVRARLRPALALQLDDNELLRDSPPTALLDAPDAPPPTQLYIAGLPEGVMETTDGGKNFNGCIREVVIGGQKKDWKEMESLHNVLLDSCPIPQ